MDAAAPRGGSGRRRVLGLGSLGLGTIGIAGPAAAGPACPAAQPWLPRGAAGIPPRRGMTLTFAEEFNDFVWSVDGRCGWRTSFSRGRTIAANKEAQYYSDGTVGVHPFRVQDSVLGITAAPGSNPLGLPYNSGLITTHGGFAQCYGHFEMRAWLPRGRGLWSGLWMLPADNTWPPEIDVVELLGHQPDILYLSTHSRGVEKRNEARTLPVKVGDVTTGFHTYGVTWRPEEIRYFLDDRQIAVLPTPADMHKPMFLLANLAVGGPGSWPGPPDAGTVFPARMLIDHIRAWRFDGE